MFTSSRAVYGPSRLTISVLVASPRLRRDCTRLAYLDWLLEDGLGRAILSI